MVTTERDRGIGLETESLTAVHWAAVGLAVLTGVIHLYLYAVEGFLPFLLGGLGYLGAVVLLLLNVRRLILYAVGIPFVLVHIAGWVAAGMPDGGWALAAAPALVNLGTVDKFVEVLLLVALAYLVWASVRTPVPSGQREQTS
ncbi:hypothetical protein [Halosimplex halophilum]|uniref:hypothetical protein n=1 Tax=Halosimplex halophilum TaxID=2559572 RepID=UPI00107F5989|nr:hypothetical protein [Halosimplex halophilum]